MNLSTRLKRIEERLAAQPSPDAERERHRQILGTIPLEVRRQWLDSVRRAAERDGTANDWQGPINFDELDLPAELIRQIQDAFANGGWRGDPDPARSNDPPQGAVDPAGGPGAIGEPNLNPEEMTND